MNLSVHPSRARPRAMTTCATRPTYMGGGVLFACAVMLLTAHAASEPACTTLHRHLRTVHSSDHCAMALHAPKVALLFLMRGNVPHEKLWHRWFEELGSLAFRGCMTGETDQFMECTHERRADPISQQHLFSVRPSALSSCCLACKTRHAVVLLVLLLT